MIKKYKTKSSNGNLTTRVLGYSALCGALVANANDAKAQIIYTDVNPDTTLAAGVYDIDFDGDGTFDFQLNQNFNAGLSANACQVYNPNGANNKVMVSTGAAGYLYPLKLNAGAPIALNDAAMKDFTAQNAMSFVFFYTGSAMGFGNFIGQSGFWGLQFTSGAGAEHTGWVEIECAADGATMTLKSYAFNSVAGDPINAGDAGSIGIGEVKNEGIKIGNVFPNPLSRGMAKMRVNAAKSETFTFELCNAMGTAVATETRNINAGNNVVNLDYTKVATGSYFVKISGENFSTFKKINITN